MGESWRMAADRLSGGRLTDGLGLPEHGGDVGDADSRRPWADHHDAGERAAVVIAPRTSNLSIGMHGDVEAGAGR